MQHGKLNLINTISTSSGSNASGFIISGVMSEGLEEVVFWILLTLVMYFSNERSSDFPVR